MDLFVVNMQQDVCESCGNAVGVEDIGQELASNIHGGIRMLDENHRCCKRGRSSANAVQVIVRLQEDVVDYKRGVNAERSRDGERESEV